MLMKPLECSQDVEVRKVVISSAAELCFRIGATWHIKEGELGARIDQRLSFRLWKFTLFFPHCRQPGTVIWHMKEARACNRRETVQAWALPLFLTRRQGDSSIFPCMQASRRTHAEPIHGSAM
eukprot:1152083-Pelagomonas_calceolata.AAC.4